MHVPKPNRLELINRKEVIKPFSSLLSLVVDGLVVTGHGSLLEGFKGIVSKAVHFCFTTLVGEGDQGHIESNSPSESVGWA